MKVNYKVVLYSMLCSFLINCNESTEAKNMIEKVIDDQNSIPNIDMTGIPEKYSEQDFVYRVFDFGDRSHSPNGMVLYPDGSIFRYSDVKMVFKEGTITSESVPLEWRLETNLNDKAVANIKKLVSEFDNSPNSSAGSETPVAISFYRDNELVSIKVYGDASSKDYDTYTKINNEISLGVKRE